MTLRNPTDAQLDAAWLLAKKLHPEYVSAFLDCFPTDSENVWRARKYYLGKLREVATTLRAHGVTVTFDP